MSKVAFISCVSKKLPYRAKAKDLYISDLFKKSLAYARMIKPDKVFILSAEYGLVGLEDELDPYEKTLNNMKTHEIRSWAERVKGQMIGQVDYEADEAIFLAGERYREHLISLFRKAKAPLADKRIGEQLKWLKDQLAGQGGKYDPWVTPAAQESEKEPPSEDKEPPFERPGLWLVQHDGGGDEAMPDGCQRLHKWANTLPAFEFPFDERQLPQNGLYLLFEKGESAHGAKRIVRVGTHTGQNQLRSRLKQHFLTENKDRSIFRKNIGRCLLNRNKDPYLRQWEFDLTTRAAKEKYLSQINLAKQKAIEREVSDSIRGNFSFVVVRIDDKEERLDLESKIISTVSLCKECEPSPDWLGMYSPKIKIRESGLWLENELYKKPLSEDDFERLISGTALRQSGTEEKLPRADNGVAMGLEESARALIGYIRSLPDFEIQEPTKRYHHMGATITDAILQSGQRYETVIYPRVEFILKNYPEAETTDGFMRLIQEKGAKEVLQWKDAEKPRRLVELIELLLSEGVHTEEDLITWLPDDFSVIKLRKIRGIGAKTVDYIKMMVELPTVAVDRHLLRFLAKAGIGHVSYNKARDILHEAARQMGIHESALDNSIWVYMSSRS